MFGSTLTTWSIRIAGRSISPRFGTRLIGTMSRSDTLERWRG